MWYNRLILRLLRSPLHFMLSRGMLILRITGRKSGKRIEVPVNYTMDPDTPKLLLITSQPERTWWRNLRGGAQLDLCLRGRWMTCWGEAFDDPDRVEQGLFSIFNSKPAIARHFDVRRDEPGAWNVEDLERAALSRILVQIKLP